LVYVKKSLHAVSRSQFLNFGQKLLASRLSFFSLFGLLGLASGHVSDTS
jgi:hypothetical protein